MSRNKLMSHDAPVVMDKFLVPLVLVKPARNKIKGCKPLAWLWAAYIYATVTIWW